MTPLDRATLPEAMRAITAAIQTSRDVSVGLIEVLVATGRLPSEVDATIARLTALIEGPLEDTLTQAIEHDGEHLAHVRRFFLEPQELYTIEELAALWRVTPDDVRDIYHDEIAGQSQLGHAATVRIAWENAVGAAVTFSLLRPFDIERALGNDFTRVRSDRWRTVPVLIRLPRFVANAFELNASIPRSLALPHRLEQILFEFFASENLARDVQRGVPQQ